MDQVRIRLEELIAQGKDDYVALSRLLGRNAAYVQQFLKRGSPRRLAENDRHILARYFGVDESELGGPSGEDRRPGSPQRMALVPRLALGASAGHGNVGEAENVESRFGFDPLWLRKLGVSPANLSIIQVDGDSMAPTLSNGDDILVDGADSGDRLRDGIYVIRIDDGLMVKRLARESNGSISVSSDNPAWPPFATIEPSALSVIGRVVWAGRRIA